ncbi:MAG: PilZ domain-containing protein [Magnetococcus sp. WYHC-3]
MAEERPQVQRAPRVAASLRVFLELPGGRGLAGTTANVSRSGLKLLVQAPPDWFKVGVEGLLHPLPVRPGGCQARARVVRVDADGVGMEFIDAGGSAMVSGLVKDLA